VIAVIRDWPSLEQAAEQHEARFPRSRLLDGRFQMIRLKGTLGLDGDTLHHGGAMRVPGPYTDATKMQAQAREFWASVEEGYRALADGSAESAIDVEPVPDAKVEVLDYFDVKTGEYVTVWRVATRRRNSDAN
jgi:hypothetical protein